MGANSKAVPHLREKLIADIKLGAVEWSLLDCQAQFLPGESHDAVAGDALQNVFIDRGSDQLAVPHHEEIGGGTFSHVAMLIEENGFIKAVAPSLIAGEGAVDIGAADFSAARNRVVFDPPP